MNRKTDEEIIKDKIGYWCKSAKHWWKAYRKCRCSLYKYFLLESVRKVRYWRGEQEKKVKTC